MEHQESLFAYLITRNLNQGTTAAIRITGGLEWQLAGPFLFNFAIDNIMRRTVDQCPTDVTLAPSGHSSTNLEYADDIVVFAENNKKLQHVINLVSKLASAYGLWMRRDKCKKIWVPSKPSTEIRVEGEPIELPD